MLDLYNHIAPVLGLGPYSNTKNEPTSDQVFAIARAVRSALKNNPTETICALMGPDCGCPGDENGADPDRMICAKVGALIAEHLRNAGSK